MSAPEQAIETIESMRKVRSEAWLQAGSSGQARNNISYRLALDIELRHQTALLDLIAVALMELQRDA